MLGSIAAIIIAVLFFQSAKKAGKEPLVWAGLGLLLYFITAVVWTYTVTPDLRDSVEHNQSSLLAFVVRYAYIIVASACALFFRYKAFPSENTD